MHPSARLASVILLSISLPGLAQAQSIQAQITQAPRVSKVQCLLAERTDLETFSLLINAGLSEAAQDQAAFRYAECQAAGLSRTLAGKPQLAARIVTLRQLYRELAALDGTLAHSMDAGQDASSYTMAIHASNRSVVGVEPTLRTLAALASARAAQTGARSGQSVAASKKVFLERVAALKLWKPGPELAASPTFDARDVQRQIADYERAGLALMAALGNRADASTAAGYRPLASSELIDEVLTSGRE